MNQCNTLNIKISTSLLNNLKSAIKNGTKVPLNLSSNLFGSSNDETNIPHKLLLTNTQVSKIERAFANSSSANIKFSKSQLSKMMQLGGILCELVVHIPYVIFQAGKKYYKRYIISTKISTSITRKSNRILY